MTDKVLTVEQAKVRAYQRLDGMLETVHDGSSDDVLGLRRLSAFDPSRIRAKGINARPPQHYPSLRPGRPVNAAGKRTMHIKFDEKCAKPAAKHDAYIVLDRDVSRAKIGSLEERGSKVSAEVIDRYAVGSRVDPGNDRPTECIFTNMPGTSAERQATWRAIKLYEEGEHKQGVDRINIRYDADPDFFLALVRSPECPQSLKMLLECERDRVASGKCLSKQNTVKGVGYAGNDLRDVDRFLKSQFYKDDRVNKALAPFKFSAGRAVQTHRRGDVELPKQIDDAARQRICAGLLSYIRDQGTALERRVVLADGRVVTGEPPCLIVLHPPEPSNHPDNWHFHFQFHDRVVADNDDGTPAFATHKVSALTRMGMVKNFRTECARLVNVELAAAGLDDQVSGESFAKLGIDAVPQRHLGSDNRRIAGSNILASIDHANRIESWQRPFRDQLKQTAAAAAALDIDSAAWRSRVENTSGLTDERRDDLRKKCDELREAQAAADQLNAELGELRLMIEMQRSGLAEAEAKARRRSLETAKDASKRQAEAAQAADELRKLDISLEAEFAAVAARMVEHEQQLACAKTLRTELRAATSKSPPEVHRAFDLLMDLPILVVRSGALLAFSSDGDYERRQTRGLDLSHADMQTRLAALEGVQQRELAICQEVLTKHGYRSLIGRVNRGSAEYDRICRKWSASAAASELITAAYRNELMAKRVAPAAGVANAAIAANRPAFKSGSATVSPHIVPDPASQSPRSVDSTRHLIAPAEPAPIRTGQPIVDGPDSDKIRADHAKAMRQHRARIAAADNIDIHDQGQSPLGVDPQKHATPAPSAPLTSTSLYPTIITTPETSVAMINEVRMAGFTVSETGHVRIFDRSVGIYRAFDEDLDPARREQLKRLLEPYTSQAALYNASEYAFAVIDRERKTLQPNPPDPQPVEVRTSAPPIPIAGQEQPIDQIHEPPAPQQREARVDAPQAVDRRAKGTPLAG